MVVPTSSKPSTSESSKFCDFFPEVFSEKSLSVQKKCRKKTISRNKDVHINSLKVSIAEAYNRYKRENDVMNEVDTHHLVTTENEEIAVVKKDNVFAEEVTESDMDIIAKRMTLQQQQFKMHQERRERKMIQNVIRIFEFLTEKEARYALTDCENDEEAVIMKFSDTLLGYISIIRKQIAKDNSPVQIETNVEKTDAYKTMISRRKEYRKKVLSKEEKAIAKIYVNKRLKLKDALDRLKNAENLDDAFQDWSPARIRAYKLIDTNPNAYYYRFNAPGEEQKNGCWSPNSKKKFFERLKVMGADGQWGIFSMEIPGRVGYQCSNYYRRLIETKEIHDPNYYVDDKGKAHYLFGTKTGSDGSVVKNVKSFDRKAPSTKSQSKNKKPKRKASESSCESENDEVDAIDWKPSSKFFTTKRSRLLHGELNEEDKAAAPNPLPGFIDPITLEEVVMPAISPSGHVMSYSSWMQCLSQSSMCPLTKQPLNKRELVILTCDNIHKYENQIVKP